MEEHSYKILVQNFPVNNYYFRTNSLSRGSNFGYHWSPPNFLNSYLVILVTFLVVLIFPANVV